MYKGWVIGVGGFEPQGNAPKRKDLIAKSIEVVCPHPLRLNVEILELLQWTVPDWRAQPEKISDMH